MYFSFSFSFSGFLETTKNYGDGPQNEAVTRSLGSTPPLTECAKRFSSSRVKREVARAAPRSCMYAEKCEVDGKGKKTKKKLKRATKLRKNPASQRKFCTRGIDFEQFFNLSFPRIRVRKPLDGGREGVCECEKSVTKSEKKRR